MSEHTVYQSPFSWRYGSTEMRELWSDKEKRRLWRILWSSLAKVQAEYGLVSFDQVKELESHINDINETRSIEIEKDIKHDLMAELKCYAEQCPKAGAIIHLGATSMDIEDNADALRIRNAMDLVLDKLDNLLLGFANKIEQYAELVVMAYTHIQPAEPTTLGYRLAVWAQDLLEDRNRIKNERDKVRGKGFKGAVGSAASYAELIGQSKLAQFEEKLSKELLLEFFPIATQTYTRKQDYFVISALAGLGASIHKFALDLRILQTPAIGELSEPFGKNQVGSSAMPFKRNPITAEKIDSLSRAISVMPQLAWHNAALSVLERTLDDSANRRSLLPEAFLICDEILTSTQSIVEGLVVSEEAIKRNMEAYGPFAASERVLMAIAKKGADRQEAHEKLRQHSMKAWAAMQGALPEALPEALLEALPEASSAMQSGTGNDLPLRIAKDPYFLSFMEQNELLELMYAGEHIGTAPSRARAMAKEIRKIL